MTFKHSIALVIVGFWCVMNLMLVRRQLWAPPPPLFVSGAAVISEASEEWWSIYYRGEKIGYTSQAISPLADGYRLIDNSSLRLNLLGETHRTSTQLVMDVDQEWVLKSFDFELQSNAVRFRSSGRITPGKMSLVLESAGHTTTRELALSQPPYLLAALKPLVATQPLEPGREHFFSTFDPATLSQQVVSIVIEGREPISIGDRTEPAIRVRQTLKGLSMVSWIDGQGRTLKEETPGGFALRREPGAVARNLDGSRAVPLDMIAQTAIPVRPPIDRPDSKELLRVKLAGVNLTNFALHQGRQRLSEGELIIERENIAAATGYTLPLRDRRFDSFLQPTAFAQSDHPKILAVARQIVGNETDARAAALRIKRWVYQGIEKKPTVSIPNALEVLETRRGDCNEHTVLFNALARAVGIPAKTAVGIVYLRGAFYYHAWSEVWLGTWVTLDSTLDQFPADVTHIKFLEGEIDRQMDVLQLIGNLQIEILEAS